MARPDSLSLGHTASMSSLHDYLVPGGRAFREADFSQVSKLREYLLRDVREDEAPEPEISFFLSMLEDYDQLRFRAEETFVEHRHLAISKQKALPLEWEEVWGVLEADESQPPARLISILAERHLEEIQDLIQSMRRVLRRERRMVSLSRVQQLDSRCLSWYTRQPGRSAAQKAGGKQQLMAVVREESFITLENRVLKSFLVRAETEGRRYLQRYARHFPHHARISAVKRLVASFREALRGHALSDMPILRAAPTPNYVLLYDRHYNRIWLWYRQFLRKERLAERLWPQRHILTRDYLTMLLMAAMLKERPAGFNPLFSSRLWFRAEPSREGMMTDAPFYGNLFSNGQQLLEWRVVGSDAHVQWIGLGQDQKWMFAYGIRGDKALPKGNSHERWIALSAEQETQCDAWQLLLHFNDSAWHAAKQAIHIWCQEGRSA